MNNEVKEVFTPKPTISFRSVSKKSSYLVRAKLYPEEKTKGSLDCGSKRSEVCLNVNETSTFASTVTSETYIIKYKFNCNDKCLVYLLTCDCCQKQYVVKLSTNSVLDGTVIKVTVGNINVVKHVCSNTYMSIFAAATIIVLYVMSQSHLLTKLIHLTLLKEKIIGEVP